MWRSSRQVSAFIVVAPKVTHKAGRRAVGRCFLLVSVEQPFFLVFVAKSLRLLLTFRFPFGNDPVASDRPPFC